MNVVTRIHEDYPPSCIRRFDDEVRVISESFDGYLILECDILLAG